MMNNDSQALKKRVGYIQEHLELIDSAVATMPILVSHVNNEQTQQHWLEVIAKFKTHLRKTYVDLSLLQNIK